MGKYFGTDGFRGEANVTLTADHAYQVGRFLGWYCGECKRRGGDSEPAKVVIGKDTRRSSYMFEYALASGLVASGADAYLLHVTTTPSVSYVARTEGFDCGIMISASHNPFYDNGIKLIGRSGEKMDEDTIALIEDYLDGKLSVFGQTWETLPLAQRDHIGRTVDWSAGRNRYVGYLISLGMFSFKGKKVGLDCANGSAWMIARSVFDALGATTYVMGDEPDGFNINNGVGSTHIEALQRFVVEKGLDVGFAYDGDADRCLAVDEKGQIITGDHILYICGRHMKEMGELPHNTVVTTVMSNFGLYRVGNPLCQNRCGRQVRIRVYEQKRLRPGRRAVGAYHLLQVRLHRRRHFDQPEADGSHAGAQAAHEQAHRGTDHLSPGAGECAGARQGCRPSGPGRAEGCGRRGPPSGRYGPYSGA